MSEFERADARRLLAREPRITDNGDMIIIDYVDGPWVLTITGHADDDWIWVHLSRDGEVVQTEIITLTRRDQ